MSKCPLPACGNMLVCESHPKYSPIVKYFCPTCTQPDYVLYVCIECYQQQNSKTRRMVLFPKQPVAKSELKVDRQLKNHMKSFHPVHAKVVCTVIPPTSVSVQQEMDIDLPPEEDDPPNFEMEYSLEDNFGHTNQEIFIPAHRSEEIVSKSNFRLLFEANGLDYHKTIKHMIFICCRKSVNVTPSDVHRYLPDEIAQLFVYTAIVAFQSDQSTLQTFANITKMTYMRAFYPKGCTHLVIPNNLQSIKSIILSNNKLSWRTLLPSPKIEMLIDGRHGICNLFELIAHATMMSSDRDYK